MVLKVYRREQISPFIVMEVMRAASAREAEGGDVVHLEVGQPGTGAPAGVIAAAQRALEQDRLGYTLAFGVPELRARIGQHYRDCYGVDVPTERIDHRRLGGGLLRLIERRGAIHNAVSLRIT